MPLVDASQQAIIKAGYKDAFFIQLLRNQVGNLCQQILGDKFWIGWRKEIAIVADLSYFLLTTVRGCQTLGEEYVCMVQVDASKKKIPSKLRRLLQVFLQCTSPYLIDRLMKECEAKLSHGLSIAQRKKLKILMAFLNKFTPVVQQLHMLIFYVDGVYLSISKRITSVKHVLIRPYADSEQDSDTFRWLAILGSVHLLCQVLHIFKQLQQDLAEFAVDNGELTSQLMRTHLQPQKKCPLCLDSIHVISSTCCGHLFCWKCIIDWCSIKSVCPTCREICPPSRVVCLHHYEMT